MCAKIGRRLFLFFFCFVNSNIVSVMCTVKYLLVFVCFLFLSVSCFATASDYISHRPFDVFRALIISSRRRINTLDCNRGQAERTRLVTCCCFPPFLLHNVNIHLNNTNLNKWKKRKRLTWVLRHHPACNVMHSTSLVLVLPMSCAGCS